MSLLALMADKFELEQPPPPHQEGGNPVDYDAVYSLLDRVDKRNENRIPKSANKTSLKRDEYYLDPTTHVGPLLVSGNDDDGDGESECTRNFDGSDPSAGNDDGQNTQQETKLLVTFLLMVVIGTANKIFQKLQAIPMYNYPNSLNLLQNFIYVPICFMYILPVSRFGLLGNAIPAEVTTMSKRPFVIMGLLDCFTCMLLTFAAVYLPGSLLILLPQAAIPISMILSKKMKGESYKPYQYFGAAVVVAGILVVLEPLMTSRHAPDFTCEAYDEEEFCALCQDETTEEGCLSHRTKGRVQDASPRGSSSVVAFWDEADQVTLRSLASSSVESEDSSSSSTGDDFTGALCRWVSSGSASSSSSESTTTLLLWSIVAIVACIPMALSSIYKEMTLSGTSNNIDPIFLNGWVALFQFMFSFPLAIPAGMTSTPPVMPRDLPQNIWDGIKCYLGMSTIETGCHPDNKCHEAPFFVNMFLVFNVGFNVLIVYLLKFGSANVLFMASTVMVPIGNLAFALPFMPGSMPLHDSDVAGLLVILLGLVAYRFGEEIKCRPCKKFCRLIKCGASSWRTIPPLPWRSGKISFRRNPMQNPESFEWDAPVYDDENEVGQNAPASFLAKPLLTHVD